MMLEWAAEQATEITMWTGGAKPGVCVCCSSMQYRAHAFHERRGE